MVKNKKINLPNPAAGLKESTMDAIKTVTQNAEKFAQKALEKTDNRVKFNNPKHRIVAWLAACGAMQTEIAITTGFTPTHVSNLLKRAHMRNEVERIQDKLFAKQTEKSYARMFPKALKTAEKIMDDGKVKATTRLNAAQDFMDRHAGKAPQKIESTHSSVSVLIAKLQHSGEVEESLPKSDNNEIIDVEPVEANKAEPAVVEDFSKWADDNL